MLGILTAVPQILSFLSIMCDQQRLADLLFPVYLASIGKLGMVSSLPSQYVLFQAQGSPVAAKTSAAFLDVRPDFCHKIPFQLHQYQKYVVVGGSRFDDAQTKSRSM